MNVNAGRGGLSPRHLSEPRLRDYLEACDGDLEGALALYTWNAQLAGALWVDLGHLEVALRNGLDARMRLRHIALGRPGSWLDDPTGELGRDRFGLGRHAQPYKDVAEARNRVTWNKKPLSVDQILSETTFGLWHQLVSRRQTFLWPDLADAFPHAPDRSRSTVAVPVSHVRHLRNRIGHHHRIWRLDCAREHARLLGLAAYIAPDLRTWIAGNSGVPRLVAARPAR